MIRWLRRRGVVRRRFVVACFALGVAWPLGVRADERRSEAERFFEQAQAHFGQGEYDQAIELFERSFLLSQEPLLVYDIAQSHRLKGECQPALQQYRRYLRLTESLPPEGAAQETHRLAFEHASELERKCGGASGSVAQKHETVRPEPAKVAEPPAAVNAPKSSHRLTTLALVFGLVGGGTLATGIYYLATDGQEQCTSGEISPCVYHRDSARLGWGLVAGGAALLVSAATLVVWEIRARPSVAFGVGPGSLRIRGRF